MNNVLELKGKRFVQESKKGNGGGAAINSKVVVTNNHVKKASVETAIIERILDE